jgi:predicted amidohydrolase YtcJ
VSALSVRSVFVRRASASIFIAIAACLAIGGLHAKPNPAQESSRTVYYLHGRIYTNDPQHPWAEALSVRDGKILCVGTPLECGAGATAADTVELQGRFVMPGFNDAHVHLGSGGANLLDVRLIGTTSVKELQARVAAAVASHKAGEWITGKGWDHTLWPDKKFPNRQQLDEVAPQNPVFLVHVSGHVAVANSLALKLANITKETPSPSGAEIEHDANGEPTGMLKEGAAMALVRSQIPPLSPERRRQGIELALADVAKNGVTSIQDNSSWEDFQTYQALKKDGKLTVRITEWLPFLAPIDDLERMRKEGGTTDPWLKTGALKGFTDGALGSRTAALLAPYSDDPSTSGILITPPEKLRAMAIERDKHGFQINFHAIGDRANHVALDVFEAVVSANGDRDRRDRIEHAQVVAPDDFVRFAKLNVIASMQPSHQTTDMRWAESRLGSERVKGAYAWATMQKNGVRLAFGTDYDVEPISPFRGLYACVTRQLPDGTPPGGWQPQEKISLEDCIRAYTSASAYAEFEEGKKGELKLGEYADFIVLSNDVTKVPPSEYVNTKVLRTVAGGRTVYQAQ